MRQLRFVNNVHKRRFLKIYSLKFHEICQNSYFYHILNYENFKTSLTKEFCNTINIRWAGMGRDGQGWAGSRDGVVVRALASHQCSPGSIPGLGVLCGLSLLLVLVLAPRVFSPVTPVFPPSSKTNISKFQFDLEFEDHRFVNCHPR